MKSLQNAIRLQHSHQQYSQPTHQQDKAHLQLASYKKFQQLHDTNIKYEQLITKLDEQLQQLQLDNKSLNQQIILKKIQLDLEEKQIQQQQQNNKTQVHQQINQWIVQAQNYSGVPQQIINSLICVEYQGSTQDNQICLSCYQPIQISDQCKYLPCYHLFHIDCVHNHLKTNKSCPACGQPVFKPS